MKERFLIFMSPEQFKPGTEKDVSSAKDVVEQEVEDLATAQKNLATHEKGARGVRQDLVEDYYNAHPLEDFKVNDSEIKARVMADNPKLAKFYKDYKEQGRPYLDLASTRTSILKDGFQMSTDDYDDVLDDYESGDAIANLISERFKDLEDKAREAVQKDKREKQMITDKDSPVYKHDQETKAKSEELQGKIKQAEADLKQAEADLKAAELKQGERKGALDQVKTVWEGNKGEYQKSLEQNEKDYKAAKEAVKLAKKAVKLAKRNLKTAKGALEDHIENAASTRKDLVEQYKEDNPLDKIKVTQSEIDAHIKADNPHLYTFYIGWKALGRVVADKPSDREAILTTGFGMPQDEFNDLVKDVNSGDHLANIIMEKFQELEDKAIKAIQKEKRDVAMESEGSPVYKHDQETKATTEKLQGIIKQKEEEERKALEAKRQAELLKAKEELQIDADEEKIKQLEGLLDDVEEDGEVVDATMKGEAPSVRKLNPETGEVEVVKAAPKVEEKPAVEEPKDDEPAKEAPAKEAPAKEAPAKEVPAKEEPAKEVPAKEAPAKEEPAKEEPAAAEGGGMSMEHVSLSALPGNKSGEFKVGDSGEIYVEAPQKGNIVASGADLYEFMKAVGDPAKVDSIEITETKSGGKSTTRMATWNAKKKQYEYAGGKKVWLLKSSYSFVPKGTEK